MLMMSLLHGDVMTRGSEKGAFERGRTLSHVPEGSRGSLLAS
jgi:hypothetical protein